MYEVPKPYCIKGAYSMAVPIVLNNIRNSLVVFPSRAYTETYTTHETLT